MPRITCNPTNPRVIYGKPWVVMIDDGPSSLSVIRRCSTYSRAKAWAWWYARVKRRREVIIQNWWGGEGKTVWSSRLI